jgi:hypothetical protein
MGTASLCLATSSRAGLPVLRRDVSVGTELVAEVVPNPDAASVPHTVHTSGAKLRFKIRKWLGYAHLRLLERRTRVPPMPLCAFG